MDGKTRIIFALAVFAMKQSVEVNGHNYNQPIMPQFQPHPQIIPMPAPQQPQILLVPQYQPQTQLIPVPQPPLYFPGPQYYPQPHPIYYPVFHHKPQFDCYRGLKLDELIEEESRIIV